MHSVFLKPVNIDKLNVRIAFSDALKIFLNQVVAWRSPALVQVLLDLISVNRLGCKACSAGAAVSILVKCEYPEQDEADNGGNYSNAHHDNRDDGDDLASK